MPSNGCLGLVSSLNYPFTFSAVVGPLGLTPHPAGPSHRPSFFQLSADASAWFGLVLNSSAPGAGRRARLLMTLQPLDVVRSRECSRGASDSLVVDIHHLVRDSPLLHFFCESLVLAPCDAGLDAPRVVKPGALTIWALAHVEVWRGANWFRVQEALN